VQPIFDTNPNRIRNHTDPIQRRVAITVKHLNHFLDRSSSLQGRDAFVRTPRTAGGWVGGSRANGLANQIVASMNVRNPGEGGA
jgi:hypothetical protein